MKHLRASVLVVLFCLAVCTAAFTQNNDAARLVGMWRQHIGAENLVRFDASGTITMYLRKGEIANLHTLDGTWTLSGDSKITMVFSALGRTFSQSGKLSFVGEEMVLTDEKGEQTRHVRHTGPLPDWAAW